MEECNLYKIRKVKFIDHPILKNLELDFCGKDGKAVDTVIIAGENGCGKSSVLNTLYGIASYITQTPVTIEIEKEQEIFTIEYYYREVHSEKYIYCKDNTGINDFYQNRVIKERYPFCGIFSDVDINFHAGEITTVTSLTLDSVKDSRRSSTGLPTQIKQLLIDIQALDDNELSYAYRIAKERGESTDELKIFERIPRFKAAFNRMFENLTFSGVKTENGKKTIVFNKNGVEIPIDNLSSGEKQIVYRGCFLLKDVNATNGAFVFIDEPEISLHPKWQMKIMDYYKGIFTDESGQQTSQIFAVTHSPFIIHNDNRSNDKVIILMRDEYGNIVVKDNPDYYKCDSITAVQDAFSISNFSSVQPTVYLEGRTDEMYFNKALEVFNLDVPYKFQWVGHSTSTQNEVFTGSDSLNKTFQFLSGHPSPAKIVCLFDCDTKQTEQQSNNVYTRVIKTYDNSKNIKRGIENALVLDEIDISRFYSKKEKVDEYGAKSIISNLMKMEFCEYICTLDSDLLKKVFANLRAEIDRLNEIFLEG